MKKESKKMLNIYMAGVAVGTLIIMLFKDKSILYDFKDGMYIVVFFKWIGNCIAIAMMSAIAEGLTIVIKRRSWEYESYCAWTVLMFLVHLAINLFTK
jgi:hypothetical protein